MIIILAFILGCVDHPSTSVTSSPNIETTAPLLSIDAPAATDTHYGASHILIGYLGARGAIATRTKQEAKSRVIEIWERVKSGEEFSKLAQEYSEGPSKSRGGNLGVVTASALSPRFAAALASVNIGEIALITETEFGFHIIRRDAIQP
jgi:peptidyl-prolyl cis-trans isomerase D